jgi:hypothetical protein
VSSSSALIAVVVLITHVTVASAQEPGFDTPQPEHELLERFAGEWHFERQSVPQGGSNPRTLGTGRVSAEMVGDFFVVSRWSGDLYGIAYEASQSLGYDIQKRAYTGVWLDSFMSFRWELSGTVDDEHQVLTLTSSGPAPTGGTTTFRERYEFNSADSITITGEMRRGESWVPLSMTRLTRRR